MPKRAIWVVERGAGEPVTTHWTEDSARQAQIRLSSQGQWVILFRVVKYVPEEE